MCWVQLGFCCAQIVANVHYHDDAALEVHRIDPLLAAGKCVLSEYSSDAELDALYMHNKETEPAIGIVSFATYDNFVPEAVRLLASATRREAMVSAARSQMWDRHSGSYPQQLHDALEALPKVDTESDLSEVCWAKWASNATGRVQFSEALSLVQSWTNTHDSNDSGATRLVEAIIQSPGKIGIRLEASSEHVRPHIAAIVPDSQAAEVAGLRAGMTLVAVQGAKVGPGRSVAMEAIAAAGRPLSLVFQ